MYWGRSRRKTSQIVVDKNGALVGTPLNKPDHEIENIVGRKKRWIFKKQLEFGRRGKIEKITGSDR